MVIWYLSDGKTGHLNQILGLIAALEKITSVNSFKIDVDQVKVPFLGWLNGRVQLPESESRQQQGKPDIIIGSGHGTHKALLALTKKTSSKSLVLMSPSLPLPMFDYVCAPDHDRLPFRDNCLSTEGAMNRMIPADKIPLSGLILLGGPSAHAKWNTDVIATQVNQLVEFKPQMNWTLSTSRRTPKEFIEKIKPSVNLKILCWEQTESSWLPETMPSTEEIWVTPDSVSMIYEGLTAAAHVGIFKLQILPTRVSMGIERLVSENRIANFDNLSAETNWPETNPQLNEATRCASWLLSKLEGQN